MGAGMEKIQLMTETSIPAGDNQNSLTAGPRGPGLLSGWHLFIAPAVKPNLASEWMRSAFTDHVNHAAKNGESYGRK
jgi:hypothetical protein